ncbi:hypothetical protein C8250_018000 [Streptomyces sp. So13.3]|nr:hypothetical protein [Streptomyces sp. So13.3]QNA73562.1 hypothetical protein C8250_018000 [Streptomyces sp. So13.3]
MPPSSSPCCISRLTRVPPGASSDRVVAEDEAGGEAGREDVAGGVPVRV